MAKKILGKEVAESIYRKTAEQVSALKEKNITVSLAVIIVGNDPASRVYVNNKKKACEKTGIISYEFTLPEDTTQEELIKLIKELNERKDINGILCQLPIPKHLDETAVINAIDPDKDVDCFHPVNVGKMYIGNGIFKPCTPAGVMEMLKFAGVEVKGKSCAVIGRSNIVGKPMAAMLTAANGTVTLCHSRTANLNEVLSKSDIIVAAVGKANFVTADMVKEGAVVVDVGINRNPDGKLCGDVDFEAVEPKAEYITPVPGGVGPMTVAMLMQNTLKAAEIQNNLVKGE